MGDWLALIGSVFYSPSCYRRPKGNIKEEEQELEVNEVADEKSEDSEKLIQKNLVHKLNNPTLFLVN